VSKEDFKEKARKKSIELGVAVNKETKQPASDLYKKLGLGK